MFFKGFIVAPVMKCDGNLACLEVVASHAGFPLPPALFAQYLGLLPLF
jgi:hypothetical protein